MNILFLTLRTFSSTGGIEKVGRAFSKVLSDLNAEKKIGDYFISSMYDDQPDETYVKSSNFKGFSGKRILFAFYILQQSISFDTILLSHINLLVFARMIKKIYPQKRIILMAHGIEVWQNLSNWKVQFLKKHCEIWAVSRYTASKLIAKGISDSKIQILNNCLDPFFKLPESFQKPQHLLERYQLSSDQPIIFTLTRLSSLEKYKGYDIVINSLKELLVVHPKLHYILAGKADEEEKERILNLIKSNDLEKHITLTGFLKDEEVNDHYLLADLFVMPSQGEGFGIAFIEAAACGCAAIAGNKDGSIDALLNGELGTLIDPDDTMELRKAIENSLAIIKSAEKSRLLQEKCKMHFSFESYKKNVLDLLTTSPRPSDKSEQVLLKERELTQPQPSP